MTDNAVEVIQTFITVEVVDGNNTVEVISENSIVVEVVDTGPQGPRGDSGSGYVFTQISPLAIWNINHNLGYKPALNSFTSGGLNIEGSVLHLSNNQLTITFNTPTSGTARLI